METTEAAPNKPPASAAQKAATEIRGLMGAKQLSIPDLAKQLNVSRDTAKRRLDGDGYMTINELEEIAHWLEVPVMRILAPDPAISYGK
ncbi:helix-turn-helix transcriptional regulator [Paenarthrobacter ilicis]|uniref:helix-turn-helix domain-containing protein n=1 Tax=Paenarthrobacter ilicis TaxID=43665 RepID=UPI0028D2853C|nr:helix-turn-helix transcriptional regulator [Paenarthrobacter ilicis]